ERPEGNGGGQTGRDRGAPWARLFVVSSEHVISPADEMPSHIRCADDWSWAWCACCDGCGDRRHISFCCPAGRSESAAQGKAEGSPGSDPDPAGATGRTARSDLLLLVQDLPEGAGGKCQAGLLPRQGRTLGVGHASGRGGAG